MSELSQSRRVIFLTSVAEFAYDWLRIDGYLGNVGLLRGAQLRGTGTMALSGEEIELHDPNTPWWRKVRIRARRMGKFISITALLLLATSSIVLLTAVVYFGLAVVIAFFWLGDGT